MWTLITALAHFWAGVFILGLSLVAAYSVLCVLQDIGIEREHQRMLDEMRKQRARR